MAPMSISRRGFLWRVAGIGGVFALPHTALSIVSGENDETIFTEKMALARRDRLAEKPIGEVMAIIGQSFIGTPYVAHTLEEPRPEHLVVNLHGLDCLTFVETTLTLARCVKLHQDTLEDFRKQLTFVRYRSGVIHQYPSRLHYFTDWIKDNAVKKVVRPMTANLGGVSYRKTINFMTTHTASYRQLADSMFVRTIAKQERAISAADMYMIPTDRIASIEPTLQNGDIIGTVTSMEGIDVSHTGLVLVEGSARKFLHAPLAGKHVMISEGTLAEYVASIKKDTGIVIARPLEPE